MLSGMTPARDRARLLVAVAVLGAAIPASCVEVKDSPDKKATADSAAGAVAAPPAASAKPSTANFGPDSVTRIRGGPRWTTEQRAALQSDSAHSITEIDSTLSATLPPRDAGLGLAKGTLIMPVRGIEPSALYDTYDEQRGDGTRPHEALDIPAPRGTPVLSATGGRVLKLFDSKAGGKMVYAADSSEHFILMYAHLDSYANGLAEGQPLKQGQVIGAVGTTGNAPPNLPHLHFAIARSNDVKQWWKGVPVNPYPWLVP
jgi:murein DD-endopeptidase MepM/ murein hydrolase activator NlpD